MIRSVLLVSLGIALAGPAFAINKCTGADGKTVFQDAPCMGKGETVTVNGACGWHSGHRTSLLARGL